MSGRGLSRFYMLRVAFGKSSISYVHILRDHLTMTLRSMRRRVATARLRIPGELAPAAGLVQGRSAKPPSQKHGTIGNG